MQKCKSQFHLHLRTRCIFHYLLSKALFIGSTCNAGDPVSIPGLGRSPGEGRGYLLQYSWAFLAAWTVKNLLAMWETWVWSLGQENPLEECMATHSSILAWRTPHGQRSLADYSSWGRKELDTTEQLSAAAAAPIYVSSELKIVTFFRAYSMIEKNSSKC